MTKKKWICLQPTSRHNHLTSSTYTNFPICSYLFYLNLLFISIYYYVPNNAIEVMLTASCNTIITLNVSSKLAALLTKYRCLWLKATICVLRDVKFFPSILWSFSHKISSWPQICIANKKKKTSIITFPIVIVMHWIIWKMFINIYVVVETFVNKHLVPWGKGPSNKILVEFSFQLLSMAVDSKFFAIRKKSSEQLKINWALQTKFPEDA